MFTNIEIWSVIRRRANSGEFSMRRARVGYHLNWRTVKKIVSRTEPEPRRSSSRARPTLDPVVPIIHAILEAGRHAPSKQRHTAVRIHQRLRDEHGDTGCVTGVRGVVRLWKQSQVEAFAPLVYPTGEAQADFGRAVVEVAGQRAFRSSGRWGKVVSVPRPSDEEVYDIARSVATRLRNRATRPGRGKPGRTR